MCEFATAMNGRLHLPCTKGPSSPSLCILVSVTHLPHSRRWWMKSSTTCQVCVYLQQWTIRRSMTRLCLKFWNGYMIITSLSNLRSVASKSQKSTSLMIVSCDRIKMDPEKVNAILKWPELTNVKQVHALLGLGNLYRHFIKDYAIISHPCWYWVFVHLLLPYVTLF